MPILEKVPSPIVFDHLAHIPEPEGINHPLFGKVLKLIDKGKTWVKLSGAYADSKIGPPTFGGSTAAGWPTSGPLNDFASGDRLATSGRAGAKKAERRRSVRPAARVGALNAASI